jgi:hypothetical protein
LSDFKKAAPQSEIGATKASARLPGLNIEIVHRQSPDGDREQISISLQAVPSFEAFGRFLEAANPFAFWVQAGQLAWLPWLEAARAAMLPFSSAPALPTARSNAVSRLSQERHSP